MIKYNKKKQFLNKKLLHSGKIVWINNKKIIKNGYNKNKINNLN